MTSPVSIPRSTILSRLVWALIVFWASSCNYARSQEEPQSYMFRLGSNAATILATSTTNDGGALMCTADSNGIVVIRTDWSGAIMWSGTIPFFISADTSLRVNTCGQFEDGHYFLAGTIWPNLHNDQFVASISIDGSLLWIKRYMLPLLDDDFVTNISVYSDSDELQISLGGYHAMRTCRLDVDGNIIRSIKFSPPGNMTNTGYVLSVSDHDGGQFTCNTLSHAFGSIHIPCLTHLDPTGGILWVKSYSLGTFANVASITGTMDGGVVFTGWMADTIASPAYPFIMKIAQSGEVEWRKTYTSQITMANNVLETESNQFVCVTSTSSFGIVFMYLDVDGTAIRAVSKSAVFDSYMSPKIVWTSSDIFRMVGSYQYYIQNWLTISGLFQMEVDWSNPTTCGFEECPISSVELSLPTIIDSDIQSTLEFIVQSDLAMEMLEYDVPAIDYCPTVTAVDEKIPIGHIDQGRTYLIQRGNPLFLHDVSNNSTFHVMDLLGRVQGDVQYQEAGLSDVSLDTHGFAPGMYFVVISNPNNQLRKERFVVQ